MFIGVGARRLAVFGFLASCGSPQQHFQLTFGVDTTLDSSGSGYTYNSGPLAGRHFDGCASDCFVQLNLTVTSCDGPLPFDADGFATLSDGSLISRAQLGATLVPPDPDAEAGAEDANIPQVIVCNVEDNASSSGCHTIVFQTN